MTKRSEKKAGEVLNLDDREWFVCHRCRRRSMYFDGNENRFKCIWEIQGCTEKNWKAQKKGMQVPFYMKRLGRRTK